MTRLAGAPAGSQSAPTPGSPAQSFAQLTVQGVPMTAQQYQVAKTLLAVAHQPNVNAPVICQVAIIYAAMGESRLGADPNTYVPTGGTWGVLQGEVSVYPDPHDVALQAYDFYMGGGSFGGGGYGGAIAAYHAGLNVWQIANAVENNAAWIGPPYSPPPPHKDSYGHEWPGGMAQGIQEARNIVRAINGGVIPDSAVNGPSVYSGLNASPWVVGDGDIPNQDYWTTINQYCQQANWYCFSDAEILYIMDGFQIMAQKPRIILSRFDPRITRMNFAYDITSFQFTSDHTFRNTAQIQRRATLAKTQSPTEVQLEMVCDVDEYRGGDLFLLANCGPADGLWLVADVTRSVFQPTSQITLVQGMVPINPLTGLLGYDTGSLSGVASGEVITQLVQAAQHLSAQNYPYVWGGGHQTIGQPSTGIPGPGYNGTRVGFDCSGFVEAILYYAGILPSTFQGDDRTIFNWLQNNLQGSFVPGQGSGTPECTVFDIPGEHIYIRINGTYYAAASPQSTPQVGVSPGQAALDSVATAGHFTRQYLLSDIASAGATTASANTMSLASIANAYKQDYLANPVGSVPGILDGEQAVQLQVTQLSDPGRMQLIRQQVAGKLNDATNGPRFSDLDQAIIDIQLRTVAQGASTLTITLADPTWKLVRARFNGVPFIAVAQDGYLWPPIDIEFPSGRWWRLAQVAPTTDLTAAQVTLTFEDRIVSELRQVDAQRGGVFAAAQGESLLGFLRSLVNGANTYLQGHPTSIGTAERIILVTHVTDPITPPGGAGGLGQLSHVKPGPGKPADRHTPIGIGSAMAHQLNVLQKLDEMPGQIGSILTTAIHQVERG